MICRVGRAACEPRHNAQKRMVGLAPLGPPYVLLLIPRPHMHQWESRHRGEAKSSIQFCDRKGNTVIGNIFCNRRTIRFLSLIVVALLLVGAPSLAKAQYDGNWVLSGMGDWTNANNWRSTTTDGSTGSPGVPTYDTDSASIQNGGTATFSLASTLSAVGGYITLGGTGTGTIIQSAEPWTRQANTLEGERAGPTFNPAD